MLIVLNVTGAAGVTSSRAVFAPAAAAQKVQRSPSTALLGSNPGLDQVESAEAGCPRSGSAASSAPSQDPNFASSARSGVSSWPVVSGGTLRTSVAFIPTVVKYSDCRSASDITELLG